MNPTEEKLLNILIVEKDPMDIIMLRKRLRDFFEESEHFHLHHVRDGYQILDYLHSPTLEAFPDLIVLSENIVMIESSQVLKALEADPGLRSIPVIMIQSNPGTHKPRQKYQLMSNPALKQPQRFNVLSPFVAVLENYFAHKA